MFLLNKNILIFDLFSAAERYQLLPKDEDFVFDFNKNAELPLANRKSFPALTGYGASFSLSQLPGTIGISGHLR